MSARLAEVKGEEAAAQARASRAASTSSSAAQVRRSASCDSDLTDLSSAEEAEDETTNEKDSVASQSTQTEQTAQSVTNAPSTTPYRRRSQRLSFPQTSTQVLAQASGSRSPHIVEEVEDIVPASQTGRKRKTVSDLPSQGSAYKRSRRSEPSSKSLGKRRAVSPIVLIDDQEESLAAAKSPNKKRKIAHSASTSDRAAYNLRNRNAKSSHANPLLHLEDTMPRKGRQSGSSAGFGSGKGAASGSSLLLDRDDDDFGLDIMPPSGRAAKKRSRLAATNSSSKSAPSQASSSTAAPKKATGSNKKMVASPPMSASDDVRMEVEAPIVEGQRDADDLADDELQDALFVGSFVDNEDDDEEADPEGSHSNDSGEEDDDMAMGEGDDDGGEGMPFMTDDMQLGNAHDNEEGPIPEDHDDDDDDQDGPQAGNAAARGQASSASSRFHDDGYLSAAYQAFAGIGGSGFASIMSGFSARFKNLLSSLKDTSGDPAVKLVALQELSEILSMSTEDTLAGCFSVDQFVRALVTILKGDDLPIFGEETGVEMMVLACRCLANLMEALPDSGHNLVSNGAVPVLCSKLLEIQFIDLAEQVLSTLEKLSEEMPNAIVREGGLTALLSYLDFFSTNVQRTAVTAAANCCRSLSSDSFNMVRDVTPILQQTLGSSDQRVVEQSCLAVTRIIESYRHHPDKLQSLLTKELVGAILGLLMPGSNTIGTSTYTSILRVLGLSAKASPEVAMLLLDLGIGDALYQLLTGQSPPAQSNENNPNSEIDSLKQMRADDDMFVLQNLVHRPKDQISEALTLAAEILPALPKDGLFNAKPNASRTRKSKQKPIVKQEDEPEGRMASTDAENSASASVQVKQEENEASASSLREQANEKRTRLLGDTSEEPDRSKAVKRFYALLLPTLTDVYTASIGLAIRTKTNLAMLKIVHHMSADQLTQILEDLPIANFLASILTAKEQPSLLTSGLQLVELILIKVPETAQRLLRKEGVLFEVEQLARSDLQHMSNPSSPSKTAASTGAANTPLVTGTEELDASVASGAASTNAPSSAVSALTRALMAHTQQGRSSFSAGIGADGHMHDLVTLRARFMRDRYIANDSTVSQSSHKEMKRIKDLARQLTKLVGDRPSSTSSPTHVQEADRLLSQIADLFTRTDHPLSAFELLESGLVDALLKFMLHAKTPEDISSLKRTFTQTSATQNTTPLSIIVKRLQESLSRLEEFDVVTALQSASDSDRRSGGSSSHNAAAMLTRQLKLRLMSDDPEIPRTCSNVVVSIHAIATFQAFNDYLRPRIAAASSLAGTSPSTQRMMSGALSAALAAAVGNSDDDPFGPASASPPAATLPDSVDDNATNNGLRRSSRLNPRTSSQTSSRPKVSPSERQDEEAVEEDDDAIDSHLEGLPESTTLLESAQNTSRLEGHTPGGTRVATPSASKPGTPVTRSSSNLQRLKATGGGSQTGSAASPAGGLVSERSARTSGTTSYAAALKSTPTDWHLAFSLGDQPVQLDTTIYGAVHQHETRLAKASNTSGTSHQPAQRSFWNNIYTVKFRKVEGPLVAVANGGLGAVNRSLSSDPENSETSAEDASSMMPDSVLPGTRQAKVLQLLRALHAFNSQDLLTIPAILNEAAFINNKLTAKMNRQLEEPMIVASSCLPEWSLDLPQSFPFLFPFESRFAFLQSTSFGYARLMQKWVGQARNESRNRQQDNDNLGFLGRLQRQKVRIARDRLLESAFKVFELYGQSRAMLEIEFFNEVGTGLGPTLEFYALVSKEFSRKDLRLWRQGDDDDNTSPYIYNKSGLFPAPTSEVDAAVPSNATVKSSEAAGSIKKTLSLFKMLGQFVARALMDSRIADIAFSRSFMRLVLDQNLPLTIQSVKAVDPTLGKSLDSLQAYVDAKAEILAGEETAEIKAQMIQAITIRDARLEDLALDFTLPGYPECELKTDGSQVNVTIENVEEYIALVINYTLVEGTRRQVQAFRDGFSIVFPVKDLACFTADELVLVFGNATEDWSTESLQDSLRADHGFSMDSRVVKDLLEIMSTYTIEQRRLFLSFATGSPRLPVGGFKALHPPLTIVRKLPEPGHVADEYLPSVMTCQNYIKMPEYSGNEIMQSRLHTAISEGQGAFHLS